MSDNCTALRETTLNIPRGTPGSPPLKLDMTPIYEMERRLPEVKICNIATVAELRGSFNEACNTATKYLAWIKYEILMSKKHLELVKAEVIIDKLPEELKKLREHGIKDNADLRESLVIRDAKYQERLDNLYALEAVKEILESKARTFERAYWDCKNIADDRSKQAAVPNFSGFEGQLSQPQQNFMGSSEEISISSTGLILPKK